MEEIRNRVAESGLITLDLEEIVKKWLPDVVELDIVQFLSEGGILREKEFRAKLKEYDWEVYQGKIVRLYCSEDAILPGWAFLLVTTYIVPFAKEVVTEEPKSLHNYLIHQWISQLEEEEYQDRRVIVKGCNKLGIDTQVYVHLIQKLQPVVKALMYGEACSTVPMYKK